MNIILRCLVISTILIAFSVNGVAQENPVNADIVVALDGSGDFSSLQSAIDAAPANSERRIVIYIKRGLYNTEKLIIPTDKVNISLIGESREETIISYHIYNCGDSKCPAEDAAIWTGDNIRTSATLTIMADGFRAENLTIRNTAGPIGQAQAVTVRSDKCTFINVDFYSYQDTMYFWSDGNRSYFKGCLIAGRTDYIYGGGTVYFDSCEIRSWGGGWITAPSTGIDQPYGYVFNNCEITYALNSPRGGDDGELVRLGRPWHNYPKVAWLNCEMTEKIHPEGWGDTWNMSYAATSIDLHLYEYNNNGPGADMSGRANWAGIKELTTEEAANYTVQKVLSGSDGWDPTEIDPLVQNYSWTGNGANDSWLLAENWDPASVPSNSEIAHVDGAFHVNADGTSFAADLLLKNKAVLDVTASSIGSYISVAKAEITSANMVTLDGTVSTKDSLELSPTGVVTLNANLLGVHPLLMKGAGTVILNADNSDFSGFITVAEGSLEAAVAGSLGRSSVEVLSGAGMTFGDDNAMYAKAKLLANTGSMLELNSDVTISEFYIDNVLQAVGTYTASSNPDLISGPGSVIIGRPDTFYFHRGADGNWDDPDNYTPALLPEIGETVICEEEIETTSTVFEADLVIRNGGNLRLRGNEGNNHRSTGTIYMEEGTSFRYNTSGGGMYIDAPIYLRGNVTMGMESSNSGGSSMTLAGPISGDFAITSLNNGKGTINSGNLQLTGDNSSFTGTWDLTKYSTKYPATPGYISTIEGKSENAFGKGNIIASLDSKVIFSHKKCAGDSLVLDLSENAKAILSVDVEVDTFILNGTALEPGEYSLATHPDLFEGPGKFIVGDVGGNTEPNDDIPAFPGAEGHGKYVSGGRGGQVYYVTSLLDHNQPGSLRYAIGQSGPRIILFKVSGTIKLNSKLTIANDNITIAGQTAPGDGITLRDYPVTVDADNVIIRFLRFRMGDAAEQEGDALGGRFHKKIMIDHCSMSWSTDECVSFYTNEDFTLQWCFITESLRNSVHDKGAHGYGGIWGGKRASFHHNLLAHHDSRNPRLGESKGDAFALTDLVDLRNNVIYNWQGNSAYGGEGMNVNIVNCYYKPGPATTKTERIVAIDKLTEEGYPITNIWGKWYIDGNVLTASSRATEDNWTYGVYNQFHSKYTITQADKDAVKSEVAHDPGEVTTHTAEKAYERILQFGGASLVRDTVDIRIIADVSSGTATYMDGGNGSVNGIIDTQDAVGAWPGLEWKQAPLDTDEDGMPDEWEDTKGLNSNSADDAQLITVDDSYPNIEVYINSLVNDIVSNQNKEVIDTSSNSAGLIPLDKLKVFYNPLSMELIVQHNSRIVDIAIYSVSGSMLDRDSFNDSEIKWQPSNVQGGIYLVRLVDENRIVYSRKIPVFSQK